MEQPAPLVPPRSQQLPLFGHGGKEEDPAFLTDQLLTYIGNKRSLLPFLGGAMEDVRRRLGNRRLACADLFAGSGVVARYLKQHCHQLLVNDLEAYSRVTNECYLSNASEVDLSTLRKALKQVNAWISTHGKPGFLTELYAPRDEACISKEDRVFYSRRNAIYLDSARQAIERLPASLHKYLLAPLLASASVHANTSGVFKGFYKNAAGIGQFGGSGRDALTRILGEIEIQLPILSRFECDVTVLQEDANKLVDRLPELDLVYLDPPYNQHPYGSNYFMLNLLVDYQKPKDISRVSGIPTTWNRSRYNQRREAGAALFSLVERLPAKFVLISYNSEGFIGKEQFLQHLGRCGKASQMDTTYNTFRGSRNLRARSLHVTESLYLLEK
jgi:adenine-specific DNA-methyltransferase